MLNYVYRNCFIIRVLCITREPKVRKSDSLKRSPRKHHRGKDIGTGSYRAHNSLLGEEEQVLPSVRDQVIKRHRNFQGWTHSHWHVISWPRCIAAQWPLS